MGRTCAGQGLATISTSVKASLKRAEGLTAALTSELTAMSCMREKIGELEDTPQAESV